MGFVVADPFTHPLAIAFVWWLVVVCVCLLGECPDLVGWFVCDLLKHTVWYGLYAAMLFTYNTVWYGSRCSNGKVIHLL